MRGKECSADAEIPQTIAIRIMVVAALQFVKDGKVFPFSLPIWATDRMD